MYSRFSMALSEHQLSHPAANVDPDEYLEDARVVAQRVLDAWEAGPNDLTTTVVADEFPDVVLLDMLSDAGCRSPHETAQEVLDVLGRILLRVLSHRPRSGHPDEKSNPDSGDATGWAHHRARSVQLKARLQQIAEDSDAAVNAAGGPVRRVR